MNKLMQLAAWFVAFTVMMLPVCAADQLTIQKFSGADNVNGFAKESDELTIQILAQMIGNPTPDVAKQRARVYYEDTYAFMNSCTAEAQAMQQCTYKTKDIVYGGTDSYEIKLFDAENRVIAAANKTLTVDVLAPKMIAFSISPNMSMTARPTTITYKAEDYGTETGKTTNCAGIKLINITTNTTQIAVISAGVGNCTKNGTFTFTPSVPGGNGKVRICAVAIDYLNHKSAPICKDILIDSRKPTADLLELRDSDGFVLTHARTGQSIITDVFVRITDSDVNPASVYADLSKLNPALGKQAKTAQSGEWFIWRGVSITTPNTCQVTVNATDLLGNKDSKTLTCSIGIDDTGPEPLSLGTMFVDEDGTPLLGTNGTIYAEFKEAGSGMGKANAFLDLRELGLGTEAKASKCEKTGTDNWKCGWNVKPTVSTGNYKIKILPTTRDNLNNQAVKVLNTTIRFDKSAPEGVKLVEIVAYRGEKRVRTNATSLGETVEFVVQGTGFTNAVADLRDLGGEIDTPPEHCEGTLTKNCTFGITVAISGPQPTNVTFDFSDKAGNKATLTTAALFVLGINNETAPNYWEITSECSPELLDRTTLSVFEHPVYCRLKMDTPNQKAVPITVQGPMDLSECTGQTDYISDFAVENNFAGSTEPYIIMTLVATDYTINNLSITCPMSTLTRVGNFMPQNPEQDNATINLEFYNLPLGELYSNIDSDVDDVKDRISGVWKMIGQLEKIMMMAEKLCTIMNTIMSIVSTLALIAAVLAPVETALRAIPGAGAVLAEGVREPQQLVCESSSNLNALYDNEIVKILRKFCNFITCQNGLLDLFGVDTGTGDFVKDWIGGFGLSETIGMGKTGTYVAGETVEVQDPYTYLNVKESLIFSIAVPPLCIPGIIHNLDKWRQIECKYGVCLLDEVRQQGMPISVCRDQKSYMQCRFIVGEIFNLIPFAPIVNFIVNFFQQVLSDPLALLGAVFTIGCMLACKSPATPGWVYSVCAGVKIVSELGQTVKYIQSFKSMTDFSQISNQWCEDFEDNLDDYESEQNA